MVGVAVIILPKRLTPFFSSVGEPEPEPVEPKLFCVTGAGTRAIISYFGSGSLAPGRVWNLLICSLLFCSKLLILKSESLLAMWVIHSWFEWIARIKPAVPSKNSYFLYVFYSFPPFLCTGANRSLLSLLICSFLKSKLSNLLPLLFTKEWLWAIRLGRSWQKSNCERFAQAAHDKRARGAIRSFDRANCSFALLLTKKRVNCSKNRWANSQPRLWSKYYTYNKYCTIMSSVWSMPG